MPFRLKAFVCIIACALCRFAAFAQDIHFTTVEAPKENPWSGVLTMTQDPQGYLWFGTKEGVYKYDGHQYTQYQHEPSNPNSLSLNWVECVFADKSGIIWLGTYGGGLDRFDPATNIFTHYRHKAGKAGSLVNDRVAAIMQDREGTLWVGTLGGLEKFDAKTGTFKHFVHDGKDPASLSNDAVRALYEDKEGAIWAGTGSPFTQDDPTRGGGLNKLDQNTGKFTRYLHDPNDPHSLISNVVRAIFEDSRGTFWIGTAGKDGLQTMDRKTGKFTRYLYDPAHPEKLSRPPIKTIVDFGDDHITFINEDNSGKIWIGTFLNGINIYDPHTQTTVWFGKDAGSRQTLTHNDFWCAYRSRDGIMWISSLLSTGVYKISPYQNKLPYHRLGKPIFHFREAANGAMWLATGDGLIYQDKDNNRQMYAFKSAVHGTEKGTENDFWIPSEGRGLLQFNPANKVLTVYKHQPGNVASVASDSITIAKYEAGKVWVGTDGHGLDEMDIKTGIFRHFKNNSKDAASVGNNFIDALEIDKDHTIWAGTADGLNKLDEKTGHFRRYLARMHVFDVKSDKDGNLWAATDNGLFAYNKKGDNFSLVGTDKAEIFDVIEDHEKNLWLRDNEGLTELNLQNSTTTVYGRNEGISNKLSSPFVAHDGEIMVGDTAGYFAFYPDKLLHSTPAPSAVITGFLLGDVPVTPLPGGILTHDLLNTHEIRLNHAQNTFSFGFTDIDFASDAVQIRNSYMLENYDSKWRKGGSDQVANYYNVPPGNYIFRVKSVNNNGLVTERHITIIISPPWWQTWWADVLFAILFIGAIWGFIYYRSLSLIKEKRVLEHKVHLRTEEVMQQKEEIEAQRDSLGQALDDLKSTQTQLVQREKMASLGELTAGIAHEIQNPLNFVNNFSDVNDEMIDELKDELKSGNIDEALSLAGEIQENERKIRHHGKRADSIVKGMLEHSRTSAGEKQPTDLNALADEYLRLSYHGLRAKDKDFNAILATNFDTGLPKANVVQQDMSRVLLNLFNNAFYAVNQKKKTAGPGYKPEVTVTTSSEKGNIIIKVKDNGNGIPDAIKDKIMQPFFTTKPTGEGTGLGLSLSYDIVVKGHGGSIDVNTKEGEGTEFIVKLPVLT